VKSVDRSGNSLSVFTFGRGYEGSTAAFHAANAHRNDFGHIPCEGERLGQRLAGAGAVAVEAAHRPRFPQGSPTALRPTANQQGGAGAHSSTTECHPSPGLVS
jgi:hypothetical protein